MEQGEFIPSITIMNGFRFGKAGWEFAFGPGFGLKKTSAGFFDTKGLIGRSGQYINRSDWNEYLVENHSDNLTLTPEDIDESYNFDTRYADKRGDLAINTSFVFAFGRTFRSGALNIPVNVFYSSQKGGGMAGLSVGFNIMKKKEPINKQSRKNI